MKDVSCLLMPMSCRGLRADKSKLDYASALFNIGNLWAAGWVDPAQYIKSCIDAPLNNKPWEHVVVLLCAQTLPTTQVNLVVTTSYVFDGNWWQLPEEIEVLAVFAGEFTQFDAQLPPDDLVFVAEYAGVWPGSYNSGVTLWRSNRCLPKGVTLTGWTSLGS